MLGEVLRMGPGLLQVLLRRSQAVLERFQPGPPVSGGAAQREQGLERSGSGLDVPIPRRDRLEVPSLDALGDRRVGTAHVDGSGGGGSQTSRLCGQARFFFEGGRKSCQTGLRPPSQFNDLIDATFGPAKVRSCVLPALVGHYPIAPLGQPCLHAWSGPGDALLRAWVGLVEPEGGPERSAVALVA